MLLSSSQRERRVRKSASEYVANSNQAFSAYKKTWAKQDPQDSKMNAAKVYFLHAEAQVFANTVKSRVESLFDEEMPSWEVVDFKGDFMKRAFVKVRVEDDEFLHIVGFRIEKNSPWSLKLATGKAKDDFLDDYDEDLENVPPESICGAVVEESCKSCILM